MKLEDVTAGAVVNGLATQGPAAVVAKQRMGGAACTVIYKEGQGGIHERLLLLAEEAAIWMTTAGRPWSFAADGQALNLAIEAVRIELAHLFDPMMAIQTS